MKSRGRWTLAGGTTYKKSHKLLVITGFILVLAVIALAGGVLFGKDGPKPVRQLAAAKDTHKPESGITEVSGRYLLNGTIFWGRAIEKWSLKPGGGYDYARPFSGLNSFNPEQYDAWVADLECPVLDIVIPYQTQINNLQFNCRPEYLAEAAKYFDIINLSNNHTGDKGADGFKTTRQNVLKAGMQAFGHYDPGLEKYRCEIVALPVRLQQKSGKQDGVLPVAFCAYHYFGRMPRQGELEYIKKYSDVMPVFAFVHMGTEYLTQANPYQVEVARRTIDQGADFVVLNNPHWVQNTEVYKDKLIVYSTGNFIFDQIDKEGMRSVSLDVAINLKHDDNLANWLALGPRCKEFQDDCFEKILAAKLKKPNMSYKFDVVAGDNSKRLTKRADATIQRQVEERTNWAETLRQIGQSE